MKSKILSAAIVAFLLFSCGTKKAAPVVSNASTETIAPSIDPTLVQGKVRELIPELTPELEAGKSLYENNCASCHKLFVPKKFTQEDWKPILVRMQKKAHVDDVQIAAISNYITSQL
jgi:cytochrome c5